MKPSCVVLLPTRVFGGHEKMLVEWLSQAVANHGLQVRIYSADNAELIAACEAAGLGSPIVSHPSRGHPLQDFLITWRLLGRIGSDAPVLLAPGVLQALLLHWCAALLRRRQLVGYVPMAYSSRQMGFHGGSVRDWVVGHVVRRVNLWITISARQRDLLTQRWGVKPPVFVMPNRLALLAQSAPPRQRAAAGPLRVLFAGRFEPNQKGLDWLCDRLRADAHRWRGLIAFTFMGQGEFAGELARLASELGPVHVAVRRWGDVLGAMADADVLLLPSRFEGVPLVALEATHHGLPVVATRQAGLCDLLPPWCVFDFGDGPAMWTALTQLAHPARRAAALAHARRRLEQSVPPSAFRQELERVVAALAHMETGPKGAR